MNVVIKMRVATHPSRGGAVVYPLESHPMCLASFQCTYPFDLQHHIAQEACLTSSLHFC